MMTSLILSLVFAMALPSQSPSSPSSPSKGEFHVKEEIGFNIAKDRGGKRGKAFELENPLRAVFKTADGGYLVVEAQGSKYKIGEKDKLGRHINTESCSLSWKLIHSGSVTEGNVEGEVRTRHGEGEHSKYLSGSSKLSAGGVSFYWSCGGHVSQKVFIYPEAGVEYAVVPEEAVEKLIEKEEGKPGAE